MNGELIEENHRRTLIRITLAHDYENEAIFDNS